MRVESKLTLIATKQEYSIISELVQAVEKYCENFPSCESCPFNMSCNEESDVPSLVRKILSEIQVSS